MTTSKLPTGHNNALHYFLTTKSSSDFREEFEAEAKRLREDARRLEKEARDARARAVHLEKIARTLKRPYKRKMKKKGAK